MFKNIKLSSKLIGGFSVILILLIGIAGLYHYAVSASSTDFNTLMDTEVAISNHANKAESLMLQCRRNEKDFLLRKDKKYLGKLESNIGDLNPEFQDELLRLIRDKKFRLLNETENIDLDLRIISSSDRDLKQDLESGRFRKDLFYLLNTYTLYVPPLRERIQDIPELFAYFMKKF